MDVKSAFLNGKILEEVYVQQPPRFESSEFLNHVCKLDKALYGLKQALRAWYETLSKFLTQHKFVRDLLKKFDLADSASVKCPMLPPNNLGPDDTGVSVNETVFRGMIGSLVYLTASRPDIQFSTCLCARYQANPKESHLVAVKRIFRYLQGTPNLGLWYPKESGFDLKAYSDSDYAGCNLDRKSTSGRCQILGGNQLADYDVLYDKVPILCDNTSAIAISNNPVLHSKTKHIDIRYHFIRDHILKGDIELHFVPTDLQLADIFTKPLAEPSFTRLVAELGMLNITSEALTIQPSAMYAKYPKEFWYTAKVENNKITFSLSHVNKPLSFDHDLFSSVIRLDYAKEYVPLPTHEEVKEGLATLGLIDDKRPKWTSDELSQSSPMRIIYFSPTWKILMDINIDIAGEEYMNKDLKPMKPYQITDATFKDSSISKVPLTSHMRKVAKLPEKPLKSHSEDANIEECKAMSSSRTSELPSLKLRAETDKKKRLKKNPSSAEPTSSHIVKIQTSYSQASDSQHANTSEVPADIYQSLEASKSAKEQDNQLKTANTKKEQENVITEEVHMADDEHDNAEFVDSGIWYIGDVHLEALNASTDDSIYDTESEIKIVKRFKPTINDEEPLVT
ncbi:retrovirus-related pol polyprotein from transposon TNT 1-94, partial [Tanacetum coccineum]